MAVGVNTIAIIDSRRKRVNVESMISFDGVSQYASAGVNQNFNNAVDYDRDWSISFYLQKNSKALQSIVTGFNGSGSDIGGFALQNLNTGELQILLRQTNLNSLVFTTPLPNEKLVHVLINYTSSTQQAEIFLNTVPKIVTKSTQGTINSSIYTAICQLFFADIEQATIFQDRNLNGFLSHLSVYNRTLTVTEIQSIHAQGGLIPASTHAACVAHYPCTQREGNTLFDVVEQYNYAKATALVPYHATLQNFTAAQHTGDEQTAYKDFYTKTDLLPYVDSNSDGTPDQPLIEKASLLPPLRKALRFQTSATQTMTCGNVGSVQGIRLAVKLDAINQSLLSLDNTAATTFQVAAGSFTAGASIAGLQIYVDGHLRTAAQAGATLNDLKFHDVVMLFNAVSASNMRVTTGDKTIAALFVMTQPISRKIIIQLANNTLLAQPTSQQQAGITQLYNFNQIIDNAGTYELENLGSAGGNAVLSGYTAANLDPLDPSYALTDINSLR